MTARDMVAIEGGVFLMGSDEFYPDEAPVRRARVASFSIDRHPVTNDQFADFMEATGYVTVAERDLDPKMYPGAQPDDLIPGALVFTMTDRPVPLDDYHRWWQWTPGAQWQHPLGPDSDLDGLGDHPVIHISHEDAAAYAEWAETGLPSEAEFEYAARGGLDGTRFAWGDEDPQETAPVANTWQGRFPAENTEIDGWTRTSPVGAYPPNGYGLFDMIGNVWEWTEDWYSTQPSDLGETASCCAPSDSGSAIGQSYDPAQPHIEIPRKVVKGGSHLCTPQYCYRYRPAARQPQMIDTGMSHLGFRTVSRASIGSTTSKQPNSGAGSSG